MGFDDIIGQNRIKQNFIQAISEDTLAHAYMFTGPQGIGKKLMANTIAQYILCTSENKACNDCTTCKLFKAGTNPDLMFISAEGQNILVDEIRKIQSDAGIRPMYSSKKVYIITDGDKMTVQAQNSLLKTLEEPPDYCVIIITTSNPDKLLETIRSRTMKVAFAKNSKDEIKTILRNHGAGDIDSNEFVLDYCEGVPGKALEIFSSETFLDIRKKTFDHIVDFYSDKMNGTFNLFDFLLLNKDSIDTVLNLIIIFYRDLFLFKKNAQQVYLINSDKEGIILRYSQALSIDSIIRNIEAIETARRQIRQNANFELVLEVMLMEMRSEPPDSRLI